jgi:hypothetical protein
VAGNCPLRLADSTDLILASGLPGLQHLNGRPLQTQLDGYLERIVDRDMSEAGRNVRRPATLTAWLRAYAAAVSADGARPRPVAPSRLSYRRSSRRDRSTISSSVSGPAWWVRQISAWILRNPLPAPAA